MKFLWNMFLDFFTSEEALWSQRIRGRFQVLYPDGQKSQPMRYGTAREYASIFDGEVILREKR